MATIQKEILAEFYKRLGKSEGFTETIVQQIKDLFDGSRKPKAAEIVEVLSGSTEGTLT